MNELPRIPPGRDDLLCLARRASESVPDGLSARRRRAKLLALPILPLCMAMPFLGTPGEVAVAALVVLAILVRLGALVHVLSEARPPTLTEPERLPTVTILLPLREEAPVVPGLIAALRGLDYPSELMDVIALVEAGDASTLDALRRRAPRSWRIVTVPAGKPQTKPRACNVGLSLARGEVVVVFDGEDRPDPDQPRKAVAALAADRGLAVVQARLGCDHAGPGAHLLARFWALEYAVLFGTIQPALARAGLPFLLGGTSNWFRASILREVGGWDAHNVTEDADLAIRLARAGWSSATIDSTTWEEAPIEFGQWVRQRSRWLKGFAVTTAVHLSQPARCAAELGPSGVLAIASQLPATLISAAAHPIGLWLVLHGDFGDPLTLFALTGYAISGALHLIVAQRAGMPWWLALLMPVYWLLQTVALAVAAVDLSRSPTRWRKTAHGLVDRPRPGSKPERGLPARALPFGSPVPAPPAANVARPPAARRR